MPRVGQEFRRLHQLLQELKQVRDQLTRGPRQIKSRQKRVAQAQQELVEQEAELKATRAAVDKKNLDLRSKETHMADMKGKLNAAKSNREYEIITGQIEADETAKSVLEDEILEYLERVEAVQATIAQCKENIAKAEEDVRQFAEDFESKAATLHNRELELSGEIKNAESVVPIEIREQYRRLVEAYGPEALVECSSGMCENCFVQLTPQQRVHVNSSKVAFCNTCGRLLYQAD